MPEITRPPTTEQNPNRTKAIHIAWLRSANDQAQAGRRATSSSAQREMASGMHSSAVTAMVHRRWPSPATLDYRTLLKSKVRQCSARVMAPVDMAASLHRGAVNPTGVGGGLDIGSQVAAYWSGNRTAA